MGKDIDRLTRTHDAEGSIKYNSDELQAMKELAAVLRLDKGRVPNATKYIRKSITSGKYSFHDLFVKNKYVGAGQGGVQALRGMASEDGYESTGSDIEEKPKKKKQKIEKPSMDKDAKSNSDSNSGTHIRGMGRGRRGGARAATHRKSQSAKGDEKSSAQGSNEQALDAKKSEKPELAIMAEDEVEDYILNSVKSRMLELNYNPGRPVLVVTGERWTCYIRCVLHHFKKIDEYNNVMKNLEKNKIDISSGVVVGSGQEEKIIEVISSVIGQRFCVEATVAEHGNSAFSIPSSGAKVQMVLTGAHFSLLQ